VPEPSPSRSAKDRTRGRFAGIDAVLDAVRIDRRAAGQVEDLVRIHGASAVAWLGTVCNSTP